MKNSLSALAAISFAIAMPGLAVNAQERNNQVFCSRENTVSIAEFPKTTIPDGYSDLQTYEMDSDFRNPKNDVPWSDSKIFNDPVTGKSVGVIDRNYIPNASRIHTAWYRDVILAEGIEFSTYFFRRYLFDVMMISAGDKYIVLRGCNGRFPVDQRVAAALSSQPTGKKVFIKLYTKEFSGSVMNEIGEDTAKGWKKIYSNWSKSATPRADELGF